jgi:hypothetical protein
LSAPPLHLSAMCAMLCAVMNSATMKRQRRVDGDQRARVRMMTEKLMTAPPPSEVPSAPCARCRGDRAELSDHRRACSSPQASVEASQIMRTTLYRSASASS